ncbi:MAG: dTDP-4-dehydrorhamnose reductase [Gammaproteobacteria bacterium]|nr:dTDP-4-dehydrorhamnose reductase [Gammaproteobacteria bacterium]
MNGKRLLLTGCNGQLGSTFSALYKDSQLAGRYEFSSVDVEQVDFKNKESILSVLSLNNPSIIVNCGAYTSVDKAEEEPDAAFKINDLATTIIANWSKENGSRLLHISTDFVFDGAKNSPYEPSDETNPLGVYGNTKLGGERNIRNLLPKDGLILRTSWLYSEFGQNFVKTMLALMSKREEIGIVNDQIGSPTSTHSLVKILFKIIENENASGIYHWCDGAAISWYDFAVEIQKQGLRSGLLEKKIPVKPIPAAGYSTLAERPTYSVLNCEATLIEFGVPKVDWKKELNYVITAIATAK